MKNVFKTIISRVVPNSLYGTENTVVSFAG